MREGAMVAVCFWVVSAFGQNETNLVAKYKKEISVNCAARLRTSDSRKSTSTSVTISPLLMNFAKHSMETCSPTGSKFGRVSAWERFSISPDNESGR